VRKNHAAIIEWWPVLPAVAIYLYFAHSIDFIQDDAYISYRYVANLLNGHGLVFNIGERVEGITNFGWVIYMALWGFLHEGYILASRLTGLLFGAGIIGLTFAITRRVVDEDNNWYAALATLLVGANMSLAYWSPAGLETAAFAFMAMLSLYFYLTRNWLLIWTLTLAVWLRPEGALVTGLLILVEVIGTRRLPRFTGLCALVALVLSLPFVGFKLAYYGSILPNPFYAKTGFRIENFVSGFEYVWEFLKHYGFFGLTLLAPLLLYKRLSASARVVWLFAVLYTLYIALVGGDVLKVHRFFLPLFGVYALLTVLIIAEFTVDLARNTRLLVVFVMTVVLIGLTVYMPRATVHQFAYYEKKFTRKMNFMADNMAAADSTNFSVALPTIGIFGYKLLGHDIIDMVGLTDSTIARHAEEPIPGMTTTWKERNHNSKYILERAPDYILFSTGIKPSAPAERALCLYPQFLDSYRSVGWFYRASDEDRLGSLSAVFKKVRPIEGELRPTYPVEYVQHYKKGLDYYVAGQDSKAIEEYDRAIEISPPPPYIYLLYQRAFSLIRTNQTEQAVAALNGIIARDSLVYEAHRDMYLITYVQGDTARAAIHDRWLNKLVPWLVPKVHEDARVMRQRFLERIGGY